MQVTSRINHTNLKILDDKMKRCLLKATDAMLNDVRQAQIMPFETGAMQNRGTFVDDSQINKGIALIKTDTPYARRLYFHPEFNFRTNKNPNAQGQWYEPWIHGSKKLFLSMAFAKFMRRELQ